jgi:hypothetical protein
VGGYQAEVAPGKSASHLHHILIIVGHWGLHELLLVVVATYEIFLKGNAHLRMFCYTFAHKVRLTQWVGGVPRRKLFLRSVE